MSGLDDLAVVRDRLAGLGREPTTRDVAQAMADCGLVVTDASLLATVSALRRESVGAGPLESLLADPGVTDVLVNGPGQVWTDGPDGLRLSDVTFASDAEVRRLAQRLAASVGRRLDDATPWVDARLADGTRVHAVLGVLGDVGTCLSLRVPPRRTYSMTDWIDAGSISAAGAEVLQQLVAAKVAFLVTGGTGSGKTTLLASLLSLVPATERLVVVEDSRELRPDHPHCIRLEARPANAEGRGRVTLTDLVRQALRMRPDRLVVGEVRGAELCDLLAAMNTGHEGGCGTIHANSAADVPARLEALAALGGMGRDAVHAQAAAALHAVIHLRRESRGVRRISELCVLTRDPTSGLVRVVPALRFPVDRPIERGPGIAVLEGRLAT
ncbi:TadA family conjugal transfer-associated ATPase [Microlunatus sp. Y2014]|uniref:TadA family conjugal transfer-associated ATPase n=1 Tax=Microlunatus sp. Y2014 TaxID=3418488 RepID=UPI003DA72AF1